MKVVCQTQKCKYRSQSGFCTKDFVFVHGGLCTTIFNDNGTIKADWNISIKTQKQEKEGINENT